MYGDIPAAMREMVEPIVTAHGLELVDVEQHQGRTPWQVRVVVDTPAGDGRVEIERCAEISREIGVNFDANDTIPVAYNLEVSSPGFDRALAREKDFERALGCEVQIETRAAQKGCVVGYKKMERDWIGRWVNAAGGSTLNIPTTVRD